MKICPSCQKNYTDETLNFCLDDGTVLKSVNSASSPINQPTVFIPAAGQTAEKTMFLNQTAPNQSFGNRAAATENLPLPPRKKSRTWLWIPLVLGGLLVIGVVGAVGLVALMTIADDPDNSGVTFTGAKYKTVLKDDFSGWRTGVDEYGKMEYRNGEFVMSSKQSGIYYVLISYQKDYKTTNASTKVTVRNINGATTSAGYGLLVHSNPLTALLNDYAFLIDATTQSYRVVMHTAKKESEVIKWTRSAAIRPGTQANELEVRDENGKMTFYINGQSITTLQNATNYRDGITGIYVGDGIPIGFSKLYLGKP